MLSKYLSSFQAVWYVGTFRVCRGLAELALSNTQHLAHPNTIQAEKDPSEPEVKSLDKKVCLILWLVVCPFKLVILVHVNTVGTCDHVTFCPFDS